MKTYTDDTYMTVSLDNNILSLVWKDETQNFTDDDFKAEALTFVDAVKDCQAMNILVDMRKFGYQLSDDLIAWRNEHVISVYNQIGVKKFAFVSDAPAVKQDSPENTFATQTFTSSDEAIGWLGEE